MIFDDRQDDRFPAESFYPALASAGEDVPTVVLPCGIAIKFVIDDREFTWAEFYAWGVPLEDIAELAGENSFSYNTWPEVAPEVYENSDKCWMSLVLAPATYLEHNSVTGRHVVYIVDTSTAILTGSTSVEGLNRIKRAMASGLAKAPMVINDGWKTWSTFEL